MTYTPYYLRFSSQEEAETKLTEVNYRHEEEYHPEVVTLAPEPDENGEDVYMITYLEEKQTRVWYSVTDQVGDVDIVGDIYNNDGVYDEETFEVITILGCEVARFYHYNFAKKIANLQIFIFATVQNAFLTCLFLKIIF